ncbi:MAG: hypothetical protein PWP27_2497 [Clostridiales bacterium]|jgi:hypothetical protein|nr:hypothetical protein [Clostridiales bacterium]MDK2934687.1 hypothetical protein [Clostridiales bacterium]
MDDDFDKKMEQVKKLLEDEKMAENLKMLMGMFANNMKGDTKQPPSQMNSEANQRNAHEPAQEMPSFGTPPSKLSMDDKMDAIMKIKKMYDKITSADDPRINLLLALKPYLNTKRQNKLDTAIKVVHLSKLTTIMSEFDR